MAVWQLVLFALMVLAYLWPVTGLLIVVSVVAVAQRRQREVPFRAWRSIILPAFIPSLVLGSAIVFVEAGAALAGFVLWGAVALSALVGATLVWRTRDERGIVGLAAVWHVYLTLCTGFVASMAISGVWI